MIVVALLLLGFAVADLVRWSPEPVERKRAVWSVVAATGVVYALAEGSGRQTLDALALAGFVLLAVGVWVAFDAKALPDGPGWPLGWMVIVVTLAIAGTVLPDPMSGRLQGLYADLPFGFTRSTSADTFLLGVGATLYLLATANRVVRLVLAATGAPAQENEKQLPGGRLIGPMERLIIFAVLLAGQPTAAAIIITGKGLLRLPEVRSERELDEGQGDHVGEYLLIGTFSSMLLGAAAAIVVLAAN